jgi:hypothetical protein
MTDKKNKQLDLFYLYTIPGILKVVQIFLNLAGIIAISVSKLVTIPCGILFLVVSVGGFFITGTLLGCYVFCACVTCTRIPWLKIEFVYCLLWTIACAVVASLAAYVGVVDDPFLASSVFGYFTMIAYGYDTFLRFNAMCSSDSAQKNHETDKCFFGHSLNSDIKV